MAAALVDIEKLVIRAAVRAADGEILVEMVLMAAADHEDGEQGIPGKNIIAHIVGAGGYTDHIPYLLKAETSI